HACTVPLALHDALPISLLAGFLVGDTGDVPDADMEAMRRAGLSHLVAVSGSNVSLFLTLTVIALGPLGAGPRRRAALGLEERHRSEEHTSELQSRENLV